MNGLHDHFGSYHSLIRYVLTATSGSVKCHTEIYQYVLTPYLGPFAVVRFGRIG
jgi:hypothetical protein